MGASMKSTNKNVLNRTNNESTNNESSQNFNVTVFLTDKEKFVQDFHLCAKKTAQATLEMCKVVHEAKYTLTKDNFDSFCREIGQKSSDSTIRKYLAIGEKYDDFINYADKLPNSWTSIYKITQIDSTTFSALVSSDNSFATMRAKDIDLLINSNSPSSSNSAQNSSNQSLAASSSVRNDNISTDATNAQNDDFEADVHSDVVFASSDIADVESQPQVDDVQICSHQAESNQISDMSSESISDAKSVNSASNQSLKATATEYLSDDFHVVIKFKSQLTKKTYKEFLNFIESLKLYGDFDLDIELFNDVFVVDSNEINQQTLQAISKIASDSELTSSDFESK